jgi:hypothetical protein
MVNAAYGDQAYPVRIFPDGMDEFVRGKKTLKTTPGEAGLQCRNKNNVDKISKLLLQNRQLSIRMLAEEVNIGKETERTVAEDLRKRKIRSRVVPYYLTPEKKERRIAACLDRLLQQTVILTFQKKTNWR